MIHESHVLTLSIDTLAIPVDIAIPTKHFRLLLAPNLRGIPNDQLRAFARELLKRGLVYFCAWGEDCERMHDCVDEEATLADLAGEPGLHIMTTWHKEDSLEDATEFFRDSARPSDDYELDSRFWIALALRNEAWAKIMREVLQGRR